MPGAASAEVITTSFSLFRKVEELADALRPEDFLAPPLANLPKEAVVLGEATDAMKRLWTLFAQLQVKRVLGEKELLIRAVHVAMGYEIGSHFNHMGAHVGITSEWIVFSAGPR